jgi:hypothetical protein
MKFLGKVLLFTACMAAAQTPQTATPPSGASQPSAAASPAPVDAAQLAALAKQQFGDTFTIPPKFAHSVLIADFDGDGVEDLAFVADSKDPLPDSYSFKYEVADPYYSYFGVGDPRFTSSFKADPEHAHHLLVIFGNGKEGWRAATPKAKFVLINVPFDTVELGRMFVSKKKPPIFVIKALESRIMDSAVFWDAKKKHWRWQPGDTIQ